VASAASATLRAFGPQALQDFQLVCCENRLTRLTVCLAQGVSIFACRLAAGAEVLSGGTRILVQLIQLSLLILSQAKSRGHLGSVLFSLSLSLLAVNGASFRATTALATTTPTARIRHIDDGQTQCCCSHYTQA
jgi:hypothetical protein